MKFLFLFWRFFLGSFAFEITKTCPDLDLGTECDASCRFEFIQCRENCADAICENECVATYTACSAGCPCYSNCPDGCENCEHPICYCKSPQIDNPNYQRCVKDARDEFDECVEDCSAAQTCFESCFEFFQNATDKCPCMSACPNGCPCDGQPGYHCEPFITHICQRTTENWSTFPSYVISADGQFKEDRFYFQPETDKQNYLETTLHASLNGIIYLFGGKSNRKKIAKIDGCTIEELPVVLTYNYDHHSSIVTVPTNPNEIMLCAGRDQISGPYTVCEDFDGERTVVSPFTLNSEHDTGCMALYQNLYPIIIGGGPNSHPLSDKVEMLGLSGWHYEANHPRALRSMACIAFEDGTLTIGGDLTVDNIQDRNFINDVYHFVNGVWKFAGKLQQPIGMPSVIAFDDYFISFSGFHSNFTGEYPVERANWNGTHVTSTTILTTHEYECHKPILFESAPDVCSDSCDDLCQDFCFPTVEL
ncbi:Oidioi.mRNA.OKI2018_I69.chr1.g1664.t1.cds [Oikopleura dioica]|uniref:Oidioi.mRNA.OKI2018_I69.chr1.g1664.t1.cds n=1 Tax=Oikopleura dioica TaxID=34765 RepID=A0ABN7SSU9_OIKDI|nr:Oidioi.mRNA.OKI2018_I69.chr1.g1664.t1.cds [Oikopleura dioica]